jgi:hypothetical protein
MVLMRRNWRECFLPQVIVATAAIPSRKADCSKKGANQSADHAAECFVSILFSIAEEFC